MLRGFTRISGPQRPARCHAAVVSLVMVSSFGGACRADPAPGGDQSTGHGTGHDTGHDTAHDETSGSVPPLAEPYGACAGPLASSECVDAGPDLALCIERNDAQGFPYSTCAVACQSDADCPLVGGNLPPVCAGADDASPGRCLLHCTLDINSCPQGTLCIDGDPPLCMWPASVPGHPDAESFCQTACGPCGATLLLPWSGDCPAQCQDDLADCASTELDQIFACTGGEACPAGGAGVADCLEPIGCVMGSS